MKIHIQQPLRLSERALYESFCGYPAVFLYIFFLERAGINADPDRNMIFLCLFDNGAHTLLGADIAGIDPDLVCTVFDRGNGQPVIEMNIGNERDMYAVLYLPQSLGRLDSRHRAADDIAARALEFEYLGHCRRSVLSLCIGH